MPKIQSVRPTSRGSPRAPAHVPAPEPALEHALDRALPPVPKRARRGSAPAWCLASLLMLAALLPGCALLDAKQREWVFQPSNRTWGGGLAAAQGMADVWIEFDSHITGGRAKLHALWLPQPRADAPTLLYLHGARFDVRGSAPRMRRLHELGFAVLGVDYRGFGRSVGGELPSEAMAYEDARAAWDWLATQAAQNVQAATVEQAAQAGHPVGATPIKRFAFGHSLGGAIAVNLATQVDDMSGLIVEGSFTSLRDLVATFKWGWLPVGPLLTQRFEAAARMPQVRAPVLVVHGADDTLVPPDIGRALFEAAPAPKRFVLVPGGTHHSTNWVGIEQYRVAVRELFGVGADPRSSAQAGGNAHELARSPPERHQPGSR